MKIPSYSGNWGGFFSTLVDWSFFSNGWTFLTDVLWSFDPEGKPWVWCRWKLPLPSCPFRNISMEKIFLICCEFSNYLYFQGVTQDGGTSVVPRRLQGQESAGSSCWSWQHSLSCFISLPKLLLCSFFVSQLSFPSLAPSRQLKLHDKGNNPLFWALNGIFLTGHSSAGTQTPVPASSLLIL